MPPRDPRRFDTLLRVRRIREEQQAQSLAEGRRELHSAERQRDAIAEQQRLALEQAGARLHAELDASDVRRYYQYERHLARLAVEKDADIRRWETEVESRRAALEKALQQRRIVERLQDRRRAEYRAWADREEAKRLDEIAVARAALRDPEPPAPPLRRGDEERRARRAAHEGGAS